MKVTYIQHCGDDWAVDNAARVSFDNDKKPRTKEDRDKLIHYLAKHNHNSPFNHSFITLKIKAPIFVARQLVKHKFMPWNEISRRYVDSEPEFYAPSVWRGRAKDKKQGSSDTRVTPDLYYMTVIQSTNGSIDVPFDYESTTQHSIDFYNHLLDAGVAPEQARMVLPQSMYTEWYWSGTLGAWADMYKLRAKPDTQEETRFIAIMCSEIIEPLFPVAWKELTNNV